MFSSVRLGKISKKAATVVSVTQCATSVDVSDFAHSPRHAPHPFHIQLLAEILRIQHVGEDLCEGDSLALRATFPTEVV
jgi:hypothetical protein